MSVNYTVIFMCMLVYMPVYQICRSVRWFCLLVCVSLHRRNSFFLMINWWRLVDEKTPNLCVSMDGVQETSWSC